MIKLSQEERQAGEAYLADNDRKAKYIEMYKKIEATWAKELWHDDMWSCDYIELIHDEQMEIKDNAPYYYATKYREMENFFFPLCQVAYLLAKSCDLEYKILEKDYLLFNRNVHWVMKDILEK